MAGKLSVEDVDAFVRQLKRTLVAVLLLVVIPLALYAYYLDRRLDQFQQTMRYAPPQEIEGEDVVAPGDLYHLASSAVEGQTVYVPAYSHIYHGDGDPYLLTITLSVRNTSLSDAIVVKSVRYFDTKGNQVESYLKKPSRVPPLGAMEILVPRDDSSGGSGANFLVDWFAERPVTEPIIEAVMVDTNSGQGISFARRGSVISEVAARSEDADQYQSESDDSPRSGSQ